MNMGIDFEKLEIKNYNFLNFQQKNISINIAHFEKIHPIISGNKWFKLKQNLLEVQKNKLSKIVTFGGKYSNHLHATAYACKELNIECKAYTSYIFIENSDTIQDCISWNMKFENIDKNTYQDLKKQSGIIQNEYYIPEGGDNELGIKGAEEMYVLSEANKYDNILLSVGSGTTFKAFAKNLKNNQNLIGFVPMRVNLEKYKQDLNISFSNNIILIKADIWGRFGSANNELFEFANKIKNDFNLDLDLVYNAKSIHEILNNFKIEEILFQKNNLYIHTGGLQGNRGYKII